MTTYRKFIFNLNKIVHSKNKKYLDNGIISSNIPTIQATFFKSSFSVNRLDIYITERHVYLSQIYLPLWKLIAYNYLQGEFPKDQRYL